MTALVPGSETDDLNLDETDFTALPYTNGANQISHRRSKSDVEPKKAQFVLERVAFDEDLEEELNKSVLETDETKVQIAAKYAKDALENAAYYPRSGKWIDKCHFIETDLRPKVILISCLIAHLLLIIWEPPSHRDKEVVSYSSRMIMRTVELICILVYIFFLACRIALLGSDRFFKLQHSSTRRSQHWYNYLHCIILGILFLDVIIALSGDVSMRISRPLRSWLLLFYVKKLRRMVTAFIKTLGYIINVFILNFFLLVIFSAIALQLFALDDILYAGEAKSGSQNFDDFGSSLLTLSILMTGENYPSVTLPAVGRSNWYSIYFVAYLALAMLLLFTLSAVTLNTFMYQYRKEVIRNRIREFRGLIAAFTALDSSNSGFLKFAQVLRLFKIMYPKLSVEQVNLLFNSLDEDGTKKIDLIEFLQLPDVLLLQIELEDDELHWLPKVIKRFSQLMNDFVPRETVRKYVESRAFSLVIILLIITNTILLCLYSRNMSRDLIDGLAIADNIFLILFALEAFVKMYALSIKGYFRTGWNRFDFLIVFAGVIVAIFEAATATRRNAPWLLSLRVVRLVRIFRIMRVLSIAKRFQILLDTFLRMGKVLLFLLVLSGMLFYFYAVVGMEAFSTGYLSDPPLSSTEIGFNTPKQAFLILLYIAVGHNWLPILNRTMLDNGRGSSVYFLTFWLLTSFTIANILLGLILETFDIKRFEVRHEQELLVDVENPNVKKGSGTNRWKVTKGRRRRWSRDLFIKDFGIMGQEEMKELSEYCDIDLEKIRQQREKFTRSSNLNTLIRGRVYKSGETRQPLNLSTSSEVPNTLAHSNMLHSSYHHNHSTNHSVEQNSDTPQSERESGHLNQHEQDELNLEIIREHFNKYDVSRTGYINKKEFYALLNDMSLSMPEVEKEMAFMVLDVNGDGNIYWETFRSWFTDIQKLQRN